LPAPELSPIEEHIVLLVANGRPTRAVAEELGVSPRTVEWHLARARGKLERAASLRDRVRAVEEAARAKGGRG
jgi:FixJ family two-component response regulator